MTDLTPEEEAILRPEYDAYIARRRRWEGDTTEPTPFSDWWRAMADNVKDSREGK